MRARLHAIVIAVAEAPPNRFAGGGMWEAMHGDMAGFYEARVRFGGTLYRLFCILDHGGGARSNTLVLVDGTDKPNGTKARASVYARVRGYGAEYRACGADCLG